jgi:hypothetical protein
MSTGHRGHVPHVGSGGGSRVGLVLLAMHDQKASMYA